MSGWQESVPWLPVIVVAIFIIGGLSLVPVLMALFQWLTQDPWDEER